MRYGKIEDRFWEWAKRNSLSAEAIVLAVYMLSCPHSNSVGCYRLPMAYLVEDIGWPAETVSETVSELVATGFVQRDDKTGWTRIVGFLDHNPIPNPNTAKAAIPFIQAVPSDLAFYADFVEELKPFKERFPEGFVDGLVSRSRNGMANGSENGSGQGLANGSLELPTIKSITKQEHNKSNISFDSDFEAFYAEFPRHEGKGQARKAYKSALRKTDAATLLAGARAAGQRFAGTDQKFIPHPASWLNGERWLDVDPGGSRAQPPPVDWDRVCEGYKLHGHWSNHAGDRPGLAGCQCPSDILRKHGLLEQAETAA